MAVRIGFARAALALVAAIGIFAANYATAERNGAHAGRSLRAQSADGRPRGIRLRAARRRSSLAAGRAGRGQPGGPVRPQRPDRCADRRRDDARSLGGPSLSLRRRVDDRQTKPSCARRTRSSSAASRITRTIGATASTSASTTSSTSGEEAEAARVLEPAPSGSPGAPRYLGRLRRAPAAPSAGGLEAAAAFLGELLRADRRSREARASTRRRSTRSRPSAARASSTRRAPEYRRRNGRDIARVEDLRSRPAGAARAAARIRHGWGLGARPRDRPDRSS